MFFGGGRGLGGGFEGFSAGFGWVAARKVGLLAASAFSHLNPLSHPLKPSNDVNQKKQLLETGFLHADPHPGNLLRTPDGRICVLDFGLVTEARWGFGGVGGMQDFLEGLQGLWEGGLGGVAGGKVTEAPEEGRGGDGGLRLLFVRP